MNALYMHISITSFSRLRARKAMQNLIIEERFGYQFADGVGQKYTFLLAMTSLSFIDLLQSTTHVFSFIVIYYIYL